MNVGAGTGSGCVRAVRAAQASICIDRLHVFDVVKILKMRMVGRCGIDVGNGRGVG